MVKIIFDSSTLISLGSCCLYNQVAQLKERNPDAKFIIPKAVVDEVITIGDRVTKFAWNAARIQRLVYNEIFEIAEIKDYESYRLLENDFNSILRTNHGNIELLQKGEIEAMILMKELNADFLAVDELTTRMIIENPHELRKLAEKRYNAQVYVDENKLTAYCDRVKGIKIIRSVDLMAHAYNLGLFSEYTHQNILKGLLYSLKYSGCATTFEEIDRYVEKRSE